MQNEKLVRVLRKARYPVHYEFSTKAGVNMVKLDSIGFNCESPLQTEDDLLNVLKILHLRFRG